MNGYKVQRFSCKPLCKNQNTLPKKQQWNQFQSKKSTQFQRANGLSRRHRQYSSQRTPLFSNFTPKDTPGLYPLWGSFVDENRPNRSHYPNLDIFPVIIDEVIDKELIEGNVNLKGWKRVYVQTKGYEIKINGVTTHKFVENGKVASKGSICLEAQSELENKAFYKDII